MPIESYPPAAASSSSSLTDSELGIVRHSNGIYNRQKLIPAYLAARSRRVSKLFIGDSNQRLASQGWTFGWMRTLDKKVGLYSAGCSADGGAAANGAPSILNSLLPQATGSVLIYGYGAVADMGITLFSGLYPERTSEHIKHHTAWHSLAGGGSFQMGWRQAPEYANQTPSAVQATAGTTSTTPNYLVLDIPADANRTGSDVEISIGKFGAAATSGTIFTTFQEAEFYTKTRGWSGCEWVYYGGYGLMHVYANTVAGSGDPAIQYILRNAVRLQMTSGGAAAAPMLVVTINGGFNDRNYPLVPSVIEGLLPGNSAAAWYDNLRAICNKIRDNWIALGYPAANLYFEIMPSHSTGDPDDLSIVGYRDQSIALSDDAAEDFNMAVVDLDHLCPYREMLGGGYYLDGRGSPHLKTSAYEDISTIVYDAIDSGIKLDPERQFRARNSVILIHSQTDAVNVINTVAETSLINDLGTFPDVRAAVRHYNQYRQLPGISIAPGAQTEFTAFGHYTTSGSGTNTIRIKFKIENNLGGSYTVFDTGTRMVPNSASGFPWRMRMNLTARRRYDGEEVLFLGNGLFEIQTADNSTMELWHGNVLTITPGNVVYATAPHIPTITSAAHGYRYRDLVHLSGSDITGIHGPGMVRAGEITANAFGVQIYDTSGSPFSAPSTNLRVHRYGFAIPVGQSPGQTKFNLLATLGVASLSNSLILSNWLVKG